MISIFFWMVVKWVFVHQWFSSRDSSVPREHVVMPGDTFLLSPLRRGWYWHLVTRGHGLIGQLPIPKRQQCQQAEKPSIYTQLSKLKHNS